MRDAKSTRDPDPSMPDTRAGVGNGVPQAPFEHLETLWVQITGTLCNLRCTHCFISCAPDNDTLEFMDREQIGGYIDEAAALGVKELYFTGGEPFLHPDVVEILGDALQVAPATVLTNGVLITERTARALGELARASRYSLEVRVSLDAPEEEANDAVRGAGVFRKALRGVRRLQDAGLLPIVTATELVVEEGWRDDEASPGSGGDGAPVACEAIAGHGDAEGDERAGGAKGSGAPSRVPAGVEGSAIPSRPPRSGFYRRFHELLIEAGIDKPRVKILPVFNMGMLEGRRQDRLLDEAMLEGFDTSTLQCSASRLVAEDGVYACPILAGEPGARMSRDSLAETLRPCDLYHPSCTTCYMTGMTCRNY